MKQQLIKLENEIKEMESQITICLLNGTQNDIIDLCKQQNKLINKYKRLEKVVDTLNNM